MTAIFRGLGDVPFQPLPLLFRVAFTQGPNLNHTLLDFRMAIQTCPLPLTDLSGGNVVNDPFYNVMFNKYRGLFIFGFLLSSVLNSTICIA